MRHRAGIREMTPLDGYESLIYRSLDPPDRILRITHTSRRTPSQVRAEATLLTTLSGAGVSVAAPLDDVPVFEHRTFDGGALVCLVTHIAPGTQRSADLWGDEALAAYGRLIGRLHRVSRSHPDLAALDRPRWNDPVMLTFESDLAGADEDGLAYGRETLARLEAATRDTISLLIHQDAHLANLHITENDAITLFDFDDAAYGPVEYDLAMIVFYWIAGRRLDDPLGETRRLLEGFMPAYESEAGRVTLDPGLVDLFLTYRELDIYAAVAGAHADDPWAMAFMRGRQERVEVRSPFLGVPFAQV